MADAELSSRREEEDQEKSDGSAAGGDVADMRPYFLSLAGQLGLGGVMGYSTGYAAKEIGKRVLYYTGVGVLALQVLAYNGIVKVHWGTLFEVIENGLDTDGDGKFTGADINAWFNRFMRLVSAGIPGSASFCAGVYLGLRA